MAGNKKVVLVEYLWYVKSYDNTWVVDPHGKEICIKGDLTGKYDKGALLALRRTKEHVPATDNKRDRYWEVITE